MKAILDTSVYISHYRAGLHREWIHRINTEYTLYLHAVVLTELHAGARTASFLKELSRLEKMFESRGRIVIPQKRDYLTAGRILNKLREKDQLEEGKIGLFLADSLLAASARHEGCLLVTEDTDFERMKKIEPFSLLLLKADF